MCVCVFSKASNAILKLFEHFVTIFIMYFEDGSQQSHKKHLQLVVILQLSYVKMFICERYAVYCARSMNGLGAEILEKFAAPLR